MDLIWGTRIATTDRWIGKLQGVLAETSSLTLTHLIVKRGLLFPQRVAVDIEKIEQHGDEGIYLSISTEDFLGLLPQDPGYGDSSKLVLSLKARIEPQVGEPFMLSGVRTDNNSHAISHLIVRGRGWRSRERILPTEIIQGFSLEQISLKVTDHKVLSYPLRIPDKDIETDIWEKLYDRDMSIDADIDGVSVSVSSGAVNLDGNVRLPSTKGISSEVVATVPGVTDVKNRLMSDEDIEVVAASAIATAEVWRNHRITVHSSLGMVTVRGAVPSDEAKESTISIVRSIRNVREVKDELVVERTAPNLSHRSSDKEEAKPSQK